MRRKNAAGLRAEVKRVETEVGKFNDRIPAEAKVEKIGEVRKEVEDAVSEVDTTRAALAAETERKKVVLEAADQMLKRIRAITKRCTSRSLCCRR